MQNFFHSSWILTISSCSLQDLSAVSLLPLLPGPLGSGEEENFRVLPTGQIGLFKNDSYSVWLCAQEKFKKLHNKWEYENNSLNSRHKIIMTFLHAVIINHYTFLFNLYYYNI